MATGQTVLLAGLIQEQKDTNHSGIPLLDQVPGLGNVVGNTGHNITRTELIIFIRPQIIRDSVDAHYVAEELRTEIEGHAGAGAALCRPRAAGPIRSGGWRPMSVRWLSSISRTPRRRADLRRRDHRRRSRRDGRREHDRGAGPGAACAGAGLACLMVAIAAVDARRFIIPDEFSAAALALGLADAAIRHPDGIGEALAIAALRGAIMALAFFALWAAYRRLRGRDGIGLGDVKLAGVAGVWLDWPSIPIAVEIAALAALAVCLVRWLALGRAISATTRLPFGLFLAPAIWIAWLGETLLRQIPSAWGLG